MRSSLLTRYWFTFAKAEESNVLDMGCGITAYDLRDAHRFLREQVFPLFGERAIAQVAADVDVRTLDASHVRPNMGPAAVRGVWFPMI